MGKVKLGPQTLLYPMPATLVGTKIAEKPNFMTAAWCGIAAYKPPAVYVALRKNRYTLRGIKEQSVFSINVPSADLAQKVDYCGIYSGNNKDKSKIFQVFYGILETAPLIKECPVNLECREIHSLDLGSHTMVVGEIVETFITEDCLTDGKADPKKIDPLVFVPDVREYHRLGDVIGKAFHMGKQK